MRSLGLPILALLFCPLATATPVNCNFTIIGSHFLKNDEFSEAAGWKGSVVVERGKHDYLRAKFPGKTFEDITGFGDFQFAAAQAKWEREYASLPASHRARRVRQAVLQDLQNHMLARVSALPKAKQFERTLLLAESLRMVDDVAVANGLGRPRAFVQNHFEVPIEEGDNPARFVYDIFQTNDSVSGRDPRELLYYTLIVDPDGKVTTQEFRKVGPPPWGPPNFLELGAANKPTKAAQ